MIESNKPQSVRFEKGRTILLTHLEFEDHQQVLAQYEEKHPEDDGELWVGNGKTVFMAAFNALRAMLNHDMEDVK